MDRGAWPAAVHRDAQSRFQLRRLNRSRRVKQMQKHVARIQSSHASPTLD